MSKVASRANGAMAARKATKKRVPVLMFTDVDDYGCVRLDSTKYTIDYRPPPPKCTCHTLQGDG